MGAGERIKELASRAEAAMDLARASLGSSLANANIPNKLERIARSSRVILGKISLPAGELRAEVAQEQGSRDVQQDAVAFIELPGSPPRAIAVVADGMGGFESGEIASALAVTAFCKEVRRLDSVNSESLRQALFAANDAVLSQHRRMGTTLTACAVDNGTLRWISVGDSRAYLVNSSTASQLTEDHVDVGDRLATGRWDVTQQGTAGALSSFLGSDEIPMISEGEHQTKLSAGERVVICTDGVHGVIDLKCSLTKATPPAENLAAALIDEVLTRHEPQQDNATVLVLSVGSPSPARVLRNVYIPPGAKRIALPEFNGRLLFGVAVLLLMIAIWWAAKSQNELLGIKSKSGHGESAPSKQNELKESASTGHDLTLSELSENRAAQSSSMPVQPVEDTPPGGASSSLAVASTSGEQPKEYPPADLAPAVDATNSKDNSNSSEHVALPESDSPLALLGVSSPGYESSSAPSLAPEESDPVSLDSDNMASDSSWAMSASSLPDSFAINPYGAYTDEGTPELSSSSSQAYAQNTEIPSSRAASRRSVRGQRDSAPAVPNVAERDDANQEPSVNIHLNLQELLRHLPRFPIPTPHPRQGVRR